MVEASEQQIRRVACIGGGTIGASWAAYFMARGLDVTLADPAPDGEDAARRIIDGAWGTLERLGLAPDASPDRWRFFSDPVAATDGADFVQESAPERYEIKLELLEHLSAALPREIIIASSSSGLLISRLQEACTYPERCVIGHPFNPPHIVPLVEVVGGLKSARWAIDRAMHFYRSIGKHPIEIRKEVPGHLANRLQSALWREAVHLVAEGVATVADVDAAISEGPGLRWALMGPHLTFHLAGGAGGMAHYMDHLAPAVSGWWPHLGHPTLTSELQAQIIEGVAAEADGRSVEELARRRDEFLVRVLEARRLVEGK
ncbi:MAG TPA: 3-hydroxyacyl-CoA dehydrogenase NAD-binding domain-containing protein [Aliidongia sp.]|uniref:3-hydroxyacyl-CoA dehydrogenase NAD-binding domain-containing protein n=1 Tax=Aliidongia sp. TaxID=1914230 RepID=UPI002DDDA4A0|nr:3-hydroxyacyl-CoA dehydrogenase NAD-binding domain-containing protein [Aliidongia sp.]HEV2672983.1 3-hydroxyacyl-CoA dehydrogenase NAD-binding domain-containing protein [Aliidongia sp.]